MWTTSTRASNKNKNSSIKMDKQIEQQIKDKISSDNIVLFMKGTQQRPQCGFSKMAVTMLDDLGVSYTAYNILEEPQLREAVKEFSNWPTYPQLYHNEELIGGCDILMQLYESGELKEMLQ